ncbi:MAG: FHA domain-containing protein [Desulfobacterales bacterium]|jgi:hypothetical protein
MQLIGLELNDIGIIAAGGEPVRLLEIDDQAFESPGFALPEKGRILVGKSAEHKARLLPRHILNHFWDQLNTEPLQHPSPHTPQNHAEIVYSHLARIWEQTQKHGNQIVLAVPSFYDREQLGLILGITRELSMPVRAFVPSALAAAPTVKPDRMLLHLEIHLHRIEVVYLEQDEYLSVKDSETVGENGLIHLQKDWVDMIAQEFVRKTRFDPYHQASSEQDLYDRIPEILRELAHNPSFVFEVTGGTKSYSVTLTRNQFVQKSEAVYRKLLQMIEKMRNRYKSDHSAITLQLTQRLSQLPGCKEFLSSINDVQIIELDQGAGALGILQIWDDLSENRNTEEISFFTRRPWQPGRESNTDGETPVRGDKRCPTHVLYRSIAYPISEDPLLVGRDIASGRAGVRIQGKIAGVSRKHCSIRRHGREVILEDCSSYGTFVNDHRVADKTTLKLGQIIRVGTPGEELHLIASLDHDET